MRRACLALLLAVAVGRLEIEVFHVNEYRSGPYPIEMNTGDLIGDVFFALQLELMLPLVCPDPKWPYHDDCHNKEITSKDLVVSRLVLRVDPQWSAYAACNQGLPGNVDEYGNHCVEGTYCCFCGEPYFRRPRPCNGTLGRKNVKKDLHFAPAQWCNESARDYDCWQARLHEKLQWSDPGWWYSTAAAGYCPYHPQNCSWEVVALQKVINQTCHRESYGGAVEAYNRSCFEACGVRNMSSPCWTRCFYQTIMGPEGGTPHGKLEGLSMAEFAKLWRRAFESDDPARGGCPGLTPVFPQVVV